MPPMPMVLTGSAVMIVFIALVQLLHFRWERRLTMLTAVNGLFIAAYCLPPYILWLTKPKRSIDGLWLEHSYIFGIAERLHLPEATYLTALMILFGAYVCMISAYGAARALPVTGLADRDVPMGALVAGGAAFGLLAAAALAVFASQFDGPDDFLTAGLLARGHVREIKWGFLQVLIQVGLPAFLLLAAAALRARTRLRPVLVVFAVIVWCVTLARMLHASGRLELGSFLLIPVFAWMFCTRSKLLAMSLMLGLCILMLGLAAAPYVIFEDTARTLLSLAGELFTNLPGMVLRVLRYLAFPHLVSAHAITAVPDPISYRYFIDIPLGALYMLPNFSGIETLPPMVLALQAKILPWIPVDLFSFGYYSLGTVGVLITFAAFGAALAVFDSWLTESTGWLGQALRAAWLFYLPFRLFFADPYAAAQSGFGLLVGTLLVALIAAWARRRA